MNYPSPRIRFLALFAISAPGLAACSLDDSVHVINAPTGGGNGGATTGPTSGTGGSSSTASSTTGKAGSSSTSAAGGSGGAATTTTGTGGSGGSAGSGGAGGDMGGAGGAGGDMGGAGGAGGDMGGAGGAGGGGPVITNPTGISVAGSDPTSQVGTSTGGSPFLDQCAQDEVLIGFTGTMDSALDSGTPWLKSLSGTCGKLTLDGTGPYTVSIAAAEMITTRGKQSDKALGPANCPPNQLMVAFRGKSGNYLDSVSFDCAPVVVTGDSTNGYTIAADMNNVTTVGPIGGSGGGDFGQIPCPMPNEVINGTNVNSGDWFDKFGMSCGVLALTGTRR